VTRAPVYHCGETNQSTERGGELTADLARQGSEPHRARLLIALAVLGLAAGGGSLAVNLLSEVQPPFFFTPYLGLVVGWAFIASGLIAWSRRPDRPERRVGMLMVAVGFAWFAAGLTRVELSFVASLGSALSGLWTGLVIYLLLAFPDGRLKSRLDRVIVAAIFLDTIACQLIVLLFTPTIETGAPNAFVLWPSQPAADWIAIGQQALLVAVAVTVLGVFAERWQSASPPLRRALAPVYCTGAVTLFLIAATLLVTRFSGASLPGAADVGRVMFSFTLVALAAVPLSFLAGLVRARLARFTVGELLVELRESRAPGALRDGLARVLHDPSLEIAYWLPEHEAYVGEDGRRVELPVDETGRARRTVTEIHHHGEHVAAIVHDSAQDTATVRAAGAAIALLLENQRLDAELRARLLELAASRSRLVQAADAERRRLERDLHDGAQSRLVALALTLRLARTTVSERSDTAALLDTSIDELRQSLDELRDLARGIHPAVLSDRGLEPAVRALAARAPVPVELLGGAAGRLPAAVETAAYFVVSEALTNVSKYAHAAHATVRVERVDGQLLVEVSDDGVGGAEAADGSGLRGLSDRVAALSGTLEISSPPGRGTRLRAHLPCT
jgi:signal transduction histidine kinase